MTKIIGVTNMVQKYGKLTFLRDAGKLDGKDLAYYECECGNVIRVYKYLVSQHITQSCSDCRKEVSHPDGNTMHFFNNSSYNIIKFQGVVKTLKEWAAQYHIRPEIVAHRLYKLRWSFKKALSTPPIKSPKKNPTL